MNKDMICKTIALGVIIIFITVGIQPALAVERGVSVDNTENEEDCDCQEDISNPYMVKLWLNKVKVFTNIIMSRYGHIPEVKEICQEVIDISINPNITICILLTIRAFPLTIRGLFWAVFVFQNHVYPLLGFIGEFRIKYLQTKLEPIAELYEYYDCGDWPPFP